MKTYSVMCECLNCLYRSKLDVDKGVRVSEMNLTCPHCGCFNTMTAIDRSYFPKEYKDKYTDGT